MKTLVTIVAATVIAGSAFAQGLLSWNTSGGTSSTIKYGTESVFGSKAGLVYDGSYAPGLHAAVWIGAAGTAESALTMLPTSEVTIGTAGPSKGNVVGMAPYTVPGFAGGTTVTLQIRAWDGTVFGSGEVAARSAVSQVVLGGPAPNPAVQAWATSGLVAAVDAITTPAITGSGALGGLALHPVPEPTVAAIAGLGLASMLIFRRRNS